ncbi:MAG: PQQ-binding-like beta-propeller repeat protein [Anaerolineales bacterium]
MTKYITLGFILITTIFLSACSGVTTASSWPGVTVNQNHVYIAYHQQIIALDTQTGTEKWRYPSEVNNKISFYAAPALSSDGKQLVVGGYDHVLYSINPENGQENWKFSESKYNYVATPLITENFIYAPTSGKALYALDLAGNKQWDFSAEGAIWATPVIDKSCDCLYVPSMDHHIYAINTQKGTLVWKTDLLEGSIVGTPALSDQGILYYGTFGNLVHALDTKSKTDIWTYPTKNWVWGDPILYEGRLYISDLSGTLTALDPATGKEIWKVETNSPITATPLILKDKIIVGNEAGNLYAFDLQGKQLWMKTFTAKLLASVKYTDSMLYVPLVTKDDLLVALNEQGEQNWIFSLAKK